MSVFNKNKRIQYLGFNDFGFSVVGILVISFVTNYLFNDPLEQITLDLKLIAWAGSLFFTCVDWFAIRVVIIFLRKKYPDFKDDKKDAGELGAGHTVTALYEVVPASSNFLGPTQLKYQSINTSPINLHDNELATVKFRYKKPDEKKSQLMVKTINTSEKTFNNTSENFKFSSAVAGFGMLLSDSKHKGDLNFNIISAIAKKGKGIDEHGYRSEFIRLIDLAEHL